MASSNKAARRPYNFKFFAGVFLISVLDCCLALNIQPLKTIVEQFHLNSDDNTSATATTTLTTTTSGFSEFSSDTTATISDNEDDQQNSSSEPPWSLPNVGYLGRGYDIFFGNPHPSKVAVNCIDPGYRSPVFNLAPPSSRQQKQSRRGITVYDCLQCSTIPFIIEINDIAEYAASLRSTMQVDNSAGGTVFASIDSENQRQLSDDGDDDEAEIQDQDSRGLIMEWWNVRGLRYPSATTSNSPFAAFAASTDYRQYDWEINSEKRSVFESIAMCIHRCASINAYSPPDFTEEFKRAVARLPTKNFAENNEMVFNTFINTFGTHFTMEIKLGALSGETFSICREGMAFLRQEKIDAARVVLAIATGGLVEHQGGGGGGSNNNASVYLKKLISKKKAISIGTPPPSGIATSLAEAWLKLAGSNPQPIGGRLAPIYNLLTKDNFPLDKEINKKRQLLAAAIQSSYCQHLVEERKIASCSVPNLAEPLTLPRSKKHFIFIGDYLDKAEAEQVCLMKNMSLATFDDVDEFETAKAIFHGVHIKSAWVDLYRSPHGWRTSKGHALRSQSFWNPAESYNTRESCAALVKWGGNVGLADVNCSGDDRKFPALCHYYTSIDFDSITC